MSKTTTGKRLKDYSIYKTLTHRQDKQKEGCEVSPANQEKDRAADAWRYALEIDGAGREEFVDYTQPVSEEPRGPIWVDIFDGLDGPAKETGGERFVAIEPVEEREYYPVSAAQKRLFVLQQMEPRGTAYNMPQMFPIGSEVDKERLSRIFAVLIKRHESFRTSFMVIDDQPVQRVHAHVDFEIGEYSITSGNETPGGIQSPWELIRPFDLTAAPLLRASLARTPGGDFVLVVDMHHIVGDGHSSTILEQEFLALFNGHELPPLPLQYKDYAVWQNSPPALESSKKQARYWLDRFSSEVPVLQLPYDFPRPPVQVFEGAGVSFTLESGIVRRLTRLTRQTGTTPFMMYLGILNILLSRLGGVDDIAVGTAAAGRGHADLEQVIGMFVNTLTIRSEIDPGMTFTGFLNSLRKNCLDAFENQDYPFEELVEQTLQTREPGRNPLFDVMFSYNRGSGNDNEEKAEDAGFETSKFDLSLFVTEDDGDNDGKGEARLLFKYCTRLFKEETVRRFGTYFQVIAAAIADNPEQPTGNIELITEDEKELVLHRFNDTAADFPAEKTLYQLFMDQAGKTPDAVALIENDIKLSYSGLMAQCKDTAAFLNKSGIGEGDIIAIIAERTINTIAEILGILEAGAAYLPVSPEYPQERVDYILKDSGAFLLSAIVEGDGNRADRSQDRFLTCPPVDSPNSQFSSTSPAYIIYTSGTTGRPKGVIVEHRNAVNLISWFGRTYDIQTGTYVLQMSDFTFDPSVDQLFGSILHGASLHVVNRETLLDTEALRSVIAREQINLVNFVPSMLDELLGRGERLACIKTVISGAEVLSEQVKDRIKSKGYALYNHYGPTETTVDAITTQCTNTRVTLGKPIANTQCYILDTHFHLLPPGIAGELYIAGAGVARGYLNRPELTVERFVLAHSSWLEARRDEKKDTTGSNEPSFPMSYELRATSYLYKSGDLARWTGDGHIEFLGRKDHQVKIRGFRVELGEIENRLLEFEGVGEAVVILREIGESGTGLDVLCAYVVGDEALDTDVLKDNMADTLPEYMVPAFITRLDKMPLTPGGKINRRALPEPETVQVDIRDGLPANKTEDILAGIWSELLHVPREKMNISADFFRMGGHSLIAVRLAARVHREFDVRVPLPEIFKNATIKKLARYIDSAAKVEFTAVEPVEKRDYYPLSPAQKRLYLLQQMDINSTAYNIPNMLPLGAIEPGRAERMFNRMIERHDSFRTSFIIVDEIPVQRVSDSLGHLDVQRISLTSHGDWDRLMQDFIRPFDLSSAPLVRAGLAQWQEHYFLLIDMHHIISDGTSANVLEKDFIDLYQGRDIEPLRLQYKDYAVWQNRRKEGGEMAEQENYWLERFSHEPPVLDLPYDFPRPATQSFDGTGTGFKLDSFIAGQLKEITLRTNTTSFMIYFAVINIFLSRLGGIGDIVVGTPVAGRRHADLEPIIGMFVNTLALRNTVHNSMRFSDFLTGIAKSSLDAFENQEYPFEELVENVVKRRDVSRNPLFDIMFSYNEGKAPAEDEDTGKAFSETVKFDLSFSVFESEGNIRIGIQYCTRLFKTETIERFSRYLQTMAGHIAENPGKTIGEIEMITGEEKEVILHQFNDTAADFPQEKTLHQLFEEQAIKTPDAVALIENDAKVSYCQLHKQSGATASYLIAKGIAPGHIVAIKTKRTINTIADILGILKAGAAYLPVSPEYPQDRVDYILKDSGAFLLSAVVPGDEGCANGSQDRFQTCPPVDSPNTQFSSTSPAYIIYTSGTTGRPKGVVIEHRNAVNLISWFGRTYGIQTGTNVVQMFDFTFDASVDQLFGSLLHGAALYLIDRETLFDIEMLRSVIAREQINLVNFVPSLLDELLGRGEKLSSVDIVISGAEALSEQLKERITGKGYRLYNHYGPTETTVDAITTQCTGTRVTLGKPVANTRCYILDANFQVMPVGVAGELYIAGAGVARGYLNRPELTAERFVLAHSSWLAARREEKKDTTGSNEPSSPMSYELRASSYLYKSGDLARWTGDGHIEFLGRKDHQVKIRGFRVELGEIESRLLEFEGVRKAVVVLSEIGEVLCAYVEGGETVEVDDLRDQLMDTMPDYMVPSFITKIDEIPVTPGGKVNRRALPVPDFDLMDESGVSAGNRVEELLTGMWSELLNIPASKISVTADFFRMGGHSLIALRLVSRIHREFNVKVPLTEVFRNSTIQKMARFIAASSRVAFTSVEPAEKREYYPLSSAQKRIYFLQQVSPESTTYNMPNLTPLGTVDPERIETVSRELIQRHDSLRAFFVMANEVPVQRVMEQIPGFSIQRFTLSDPGELETLMLRFKQPFDLSLPPLIRVGLAQWRNEFFLLMDIHHITGDGESMNVLKTDFIALYEGQTLEPLPLQYIDYAVWQNRESESGAMASSEGYWLERFKEPVPPLDFGLGVDYASVKDDDRGARMAFTLDKAKTAALETLAAEREVTLYMVTVALVNILLAKIGDTGTVVTGTPVAGRGHADLQNIVGMFVNTLPLLTHPENSKTFTGFLDEIKTITLEAFEHQDYPFDDMVERLGIKREIGRKPVFDLLVAFNTGDRNDALFNELTGEPGEESKPRLIEEPGHYAKFDMTWNGMNVNGQMAFSVEFRTALFSAETIERYVGFFDEITTAVIEDPAVRLGDITVTHGLTEVEAEEHDIDFDF